MTDVGANNLCYDPTYKCATAKTIRADNTVDATE